MDPDWFATGGAPSQFNNAGPDPENPGGLKLGNLFMLRSDLALIEVWYPFSCSSCLLLPVMYSSQDPAYMTWVQRYARDEQLWFRYPLIRVGLGSVRESAVDSFCLFGIRFVSTLIVD